MTGLMRMGLTPFSGSSKQSTPRCFSSFFNVVRANKRRVPSDKTRDVKKRPSSIPTFTIYFFSTKSSSTSRVLIPGMSAAISRAISFSATGFSTLMRYKAEARPVPSDCITSEAVNFGAGLLSSTGLSCRKCQFRNSSRTASACGNSVFVTPLSMVLSKSATGRGRPRLPLS